MAQAYFSESTIDDLMRVALEEIFCKGSEISSTRGPNREVTGILLELTNPRARLSRTETKGKLYSCLGELCWYLAKSDQLDFIEYYIPLYRQSSVDGTVVGAYGPRLFAWRRVDQISNVIHLLKERPQSRQAVVQLFSRYDIAEGQSEVPCTCSLQFLVRNNALDLLVGMRSNDVTRGFTHDVFCFTMLQEIVSRCIDVELGTYKHFVGSLHLYGDEEPSARNFLEEGWQQTDLPMPSMPDGDPWPNIRHLLLTESQLRKGDVCPEVSLGNLPPYWADLGHLLRAFRCFKEKKFDQIDMIKADVSNRCYLPFIERRLAANRTD